MKRSESKKRFKTSAALLAGILAIVFLTTVGGGVLANTKSKKPTKLKNSRAPASENAAPMTQEQKGIDRFKSATVKIVIKQHQIPVAVGTGFFITRDGLLATNHHVIRHAIQQPGFSAEFILDDKRVLTDFQVANCGDKRGLDLCLLKLKVDSKTFLVPGDVPPMPGETVHIIGHPIGTDFSITKAKVQDMRLSHSSIEEIELEGKLLPGYSGGPIIDEKGKLVGIASKYIPDPSDMSLGITAEEITKYRDQNLDTESIATARRQIATRTTSEMKSLAAADLKKAFAAANKGKKIEKIKSIREVSFDFKDMVIKMDLPEIFSKCSEAKKINDGVLFYCFGHGDNAVFSLQRFTNRDSAGLTRKNGTSLLPPRAHSSIEKMIADKSWREVSKKLSQEQKASFFSKPEIAQCNTLKPNLLPGNIFSSAPACRFHIKNDSEPGALSVNLWIELDDYLFSIATWMSDANMADYFAQIPTLAAQTARSNKVLKRTAAPAPILAGPSETIAPKKKANRVLAGNIVEKPLTIYSLGLADGMAFMSAKVDSAGSQVDFYGKKPTFGSFEDSYLLAVTASPETVMPPSYDSFSKATLNNLSKLMAFTPKADSIEIEAITVDGRPARLLSAFGRGKDGKEAMALVATVYDDSRAYMLMQTTPSYDPIGSFRDFKNLLANFKRK